MATEVASTGRTTQKVKLSEPSLRDILRLSEDKVSLTLEKREGSLVVYIQNETLRPLGGCSLVLQDLQEYSPEHCAFRQNPFEPIVIIRSQTIDSGRSSREAPPVATVGNTEKRFLKIADTHIKFSKYGIWVARLIVEADGKRRREELFFEWQPGSDPRFTGDPRKPQ